jgi:HAD superfamily hydrolase (TIGR01549 family)
VTPKPPELATVLVVSGGGFQGLAVIRGLRRCAQVRIIMADCYGENVGRYFVDQFYRVPPISDRAGFLAALRDICGREGVRLVLPSTDFELTVLAEEAAAFREQGVVVAVSERALLDRLRDKRQLHGLLREAGCPVLPLWDPRDPAAPLPLIGKPVQGWGGRGLKVVHTREALRELPLEELARTHIWQPFLEGIEEISADFSIDLDGRPSALGLRRRLRTMAGFAVVSEACASPAVEVMVSGLAERLAEQGGRGLFNVQVLERASERYVSDVNPRIGTSAVHWFRGDLHPVLHVCRSVLGSLTPSEEAAVPRRGRAVRYLEELWLDDSPNIVRREAEVAAVVFDLDDTLLPLKPWMAGKVERLCQDAAAAELIPDPAAFKREALWLIEEGAAPRLFDALASRFGLEDHQKHRLIEAYREAVPLPRPQFTGAAPVLESLRRRGLKLAVLTDNPPASQKQKLQATGLEPWFDAVVYTRELGAEKPDPLGFAEVARRLQLPVPSLAMVGDNPHRDVAGAAASGFGMAYLLSRPGSLLSFDPDLFRACSAAPFRSIGALGQLLWFLRP